MIVAPAEDARQTTDIERFWSGVDRSGGPESCWPWKAGRLRQGYGRFWLHGQHHIAHRWILAQDLGRALRWDDELREMACHRCDNPPCCNPAHLYAGDAKTNVRDAVERSRHATTRERAKSSCVNGHQFTNDNTYIHPQNGSRQCRECRKLRQRKPGAIPFAERTHCPQGHPYDAKNTRVRANGSRDCRACHRSWELARRVARKGLACESS